MYTIRVTPEGRLHAEASGRLSTAEALRLASQGFALADAGAITDLLVDVRGVERGPGQWLVLGAVIASRMEGPMRLAVVAGPAQEPVVRRILRYAGLRNRAAVVMTEEEALRWFAGRLRERGREAASRAAAAKAAPTGADAEEIRPKAG
ncbi:hypothetical protein [Tepidiforma thermophila]|uniref:STAS/SEC14 domain-containing protein n=1 Tax=Tepidiforma thermophila (strain KCTC 52669 / CGMCC 1.13589 / G233) TaxID=2761530 RepID=A0A2A9HDW0_TEPT2|nr:hypothetical protein [Tepidiforma thermophila]PFG73998.1 hypothetical protein A9A59_1205 [Tepidiforma thermophila]